MFLWDQILKGREREKEGKRSGDTEGMLADGSALAEGRQDLLPVFASRSGHGCRIMGDRMDCVCFGQDLTIGKTMDFG